MANPVHASCGVHGVDVKISCALKARWQKPCERIVYGVPDLPHDVTGESSRATAYARRLLPLTVTKNFPREILIRRYISGQKWERIAVEIHLEYRWVLRLHGKALQKLTPESHPEM